MPKAKGARLSLSLPGPPDANENGKISQAGNGLAGVVGDDGGRGGTSPTFESTSLEEPRSSHITSLPPLPLSPATSPKQHHRDQSRSFFSNIRAAKSSAKIPAAEPTTRTIEEAPRAHDAGGEREGVECGAVELPREMEVNERNPWSPIEDVPHDVRLDSKDSSKPALPSRTMPIPITQSMRNTTSSPLLQAPAAKKHGSRFGFMRRNPSHQPDDSGEGNSVFSQELKPPSRDRSGSRNVPIVNPLAANDPKTVAPRSSGFLKSIKNSGSKALFGVKKQSDKMLRSNREIANVPYNPLASREEYVAIIITRPLLEQVRCTRIAGRLEVSRDKTEFWLSALPWRCIDYLNYKGVDEEGIYRHAGSKADVDMYWRKFDLQGDVNLYEEQNLYDVNTITSLLKQWFRSLPDLIFPEDLQDELVTKYPDHEQAPDELKHVISQLEPWRYYLLFAITCHLSLVLSSASRNKMTIENLFTCIGRNSLRLEPKLFNWLVSDWRNCWMGCVREKEFLEEEYAFLDAEEQAQAAGPSKPSSQPQRVGSPHSRPTFVRELSDSTTQLAGSASRTNLQPNLSTSYDGANSSAPSSSHSNQGSRQTGSRRPPPDTAMSSSRTVSENRTSALPPNATRERSPLGRRPFARPDDNNSSREREDRATSHHRARSQPRSDTSRGKSPVSQGRRRRGDTQVSGSPSRRSPSQTSDPLMDTKNMSGRRRREGGEAPEMPVMPRERLESLQGESHSRKGSAVERERERERSRDRDRGRERDMTQMGRLNIQEGGGGVASSGGGHGRKDSKFRLSAPKFPEPISPTYHGMGGH